MAYTNDGGAGDGELDRAFLSDVGVRIRARRTELTLTVQELADRTQISRRLLTQIELGQANPGLVTVTKIARQLGTDFTTLLAEQRSDDAVQVTAQADQVLVWSSDAGSTAHLLVATAGARAADLWRWTLMPGDVYQGRADPALSQELFLVIEGTLVLCVDGVEVSARAGASARLRSDRPYSYANPGQEAVTFVRTVALSP